MSKAYVSQVLNKHSVHDEGSYSEFEGHYSVISAVVATDYDFVQ